MSEILHNNFTPYIDTSWTGEAVEYTKTEEEPEKKPFSLDNLFGYAERAVGLYKTATSDQPVSQAPGYGITMGVQPERRVLGMQPILGYIVAATVIGLLGYAIYVGTVKNKGKKGNK